MRAVVLQKLRTKICFATSHFKSSLIWLGSSVTLFMLLFSIALRRFGPSVLQYFPLVPCGATSLLDNLYLASYLQTVPVDICRRRKVHRSQRFSRHVVSAHAHQRRVAQRVIHVDGAVTSRQDCRRSRRISLPPRHQLRLCKLPSAVSLSFVWLFLTI